MFQRLHLKLTLLNAAILLGLFLSLIIGIYIFAQLEMSFNAENITSTIITKIKTGQVVDQSNTDSLPPCPAKNAPLNVSMVHDLVPPPPDNTIAPPANSEILGPGLFYVQTTPDGNICFKSSRIPIFQDDLSSITEKALATSSPFGTLEHNSYRFFFKKEALNPQGGTVIVFKDYSPEATLLRILITALTAVGLIGVLLSLIASYIMAKRAVWPIEKAWQQQRDFLADASHELRTPLAVIQTNLDVVFDNPEETVLSQHKWLNNIREESISMAQLVDSLLFLARADSHQQMLDRHHIALNDILAQAVAPFEPVANKKSLLLKISTAAAVNLIGDEIRLKQVIAILIDNAIRHTSSGGTISLNLTKTIFSAVLTVADSGEGMEPQHLNKIFDRFYQVDESRAKGGSGLGLAIAKWIIEDHGGTITVDSTPGFGTKFTIQLPLEKINEKALLR
ncbi:MAG: phoR 1 [Firmicutes bacterium]|nr:phoR 1 [Bacillota bacterium]